MPYFLPTTPREVQERGWDQVDFIVITGDAYVDHPSFGAAIIGRVLESQGFRVGIIDQPDWKSTKDFARLGRPRLAFLVTAGNIDSMVSHYTVAKRRRKTDAYSPGGQTGKRPDRACLVYSHRVRKAFKDVPIILGGLEASLRRLAHYDYWDDRVRRSILMDAKADLIIYGMGERAVTEVAHALDSGLPIELITYVPGTVIKMSDLSPVYQPITLPSYQEVASSRLSYAQSFWLQYQNTHALTAKPLVEAYGSTYVVQNPPASALSTEELDSLYLLPFTKECHPKYKQQRVPALDEVKYSLTSSRGCFGGCSFCALTFHQGREVQARSQDSLITEAKELISDPDFKGYIHDVGGPTANFREKACKRQVKHGVCSTRQCLHPRRCPNLRVDHSNYLALLRRLRNLPGVKKVFIRSGVRYDYLVYDKDESFFHELCQHHISGQLKVAPEHIDPKVLHYMGKPSKEVYLRFVKRYEQINTKLGKRQYLVPYYISSHPGSTLQSAIQLAEFIKASGHIPEQAQDFYPTPGTLATCMYHTELDPRTMRPVYVAKDGEEKAMQRALIQFNEPRNYRLVLKALQRAKREDLIGFNSSCLIAPPVRKSKNKKRKRD